MNQIDENELRKKIRSDLQKKHQEKQGQKDTEIEQSNPGEQKLSEPLKRRIKQLEEDRLFSHHQQFAKCENHLHETTWLTALEKAEQHEYFAIDETRWQRIKNNLFSSKKKNPQSVEIDEYRAKIVAENICANKTNNIDKFFIAFEF